MTDVKPSHGAKFWPRVGAFVIDYVVIGVVCLTLGFIDFDAWASLGQWGRLVGLAISLAYFGVLTSRLGGGQTLGMRLFNLRVVGSNGEALTLSAALGRAIILVTPFLLNGFQLFEPRPIVAMVGLGLITAGLFGIGLAQIFLLIFNRPSRRFLHDLVFDSSVVAWGEPAPTTSAPAPGLVSAVAFGIVGVGFSLGMIAGGLALGHAAPRLAPLLKVQSAVRALPDVSSVGVADGLITFRGLHKPSTVIHALMIEARLRRWPRDREAEVKTIGAAATRVYAVLPDHRMRVTLVYGFNLGFASFNRTFSNGYTPPLAAPMLRTG